MPKKIDPSHVEMVEILGTSEKSYHGLLDLGPLVADQSLVFHDNDVASMYSHSTQPIRCYGESEMRDTVPSLSIMQYETLSRIEKKKRKLLANQEEYVTTINWLLEVMGETPVPQRRSVHREVIAEVQKSLKGNLLYKAASFDRTIGYEIEETDHGSIFLPIGFGVDTRVTNQQRQVARMAKEQFGKRWRYGMVNIYSLGV